MPPDRIAHYQLQDKIGQGGMGEVYRALDTRLERAVALKLLPREFLRDVERLARFRREAKLLGALQHANIAAVYGLEEEGEQIALAMEMVEGEDLSARLKRGPLPLDDVLDIARQLAEGLEAAHERGIVHRDLKPANLKVNPDGQLKILDFGLARAFQDGPASSENLHESPTITAALTQGGVILGTAAYMSPEQARGKRIDHRADIWAFGTILFEMITGERLFEGETISDIVAAVLRADIPLDKMPEDTPRGFVRLLERCLERDPRRRLRDIGEARVRLEQWKESPDSIHESYTRLETPLAPEARRLAWLPWALFGVSAALCVFLWLGRPTETGPTVPMTHLEIDTPSEEDIPIGTRKNVFLSPDGQWMGWRTPAGIQLRRSDSPDARMLTGTEFCEAATFSPDSRWLAFLARGQLYRVSVSGGAPFAICTTGGTPRGMAWVDENTIVCTEGIANCISAFDVRDGSRRELTQIDIEAGERSHRWPTATPDGQGVLYECQFIGRDYDQSDVRYVSLDGKKAHTVHAGGAGAVALASGILVFGRGSTLFAADLDLHSMQLRSLPLPVLDGVDGSTGNQEDDDGSMQFEIDRNGSIFYMSSKLADSALSQLAWLDFGSHGVERIGEPGEYRNVQISPDGRMAVVQTRIDGDWGLQALDLETMTGQLLSQRRSAERPGAWSPDSQTYYWSQGSDDATRFEIWRRRVDGSTPPELVVEMPPGGGAWPSAISPDGRYLLCGSMDTATLGDVYCVDLSQTPRKLEPYLQNPEDQALSEFLYDGSFVAYAENRRDGIGSAISVRRFPDDGSVWTIPSIAGGYLEFQWIPGLGGLLAYGLNVAYLIPLRFENQNVLVGAPREFVDFNIFGGDSVVLTGDFHPDGKRGLFRLRAGEAGASAAGESSLMMILNWEQSVVRRVRSSG